jgi:putative FmdB family regulatory protein
MPMYDFECQVCGKRFTDLSSYDRRDEKRCPDCKGATRVLVTSFAVKSGAGTTAAPSKGFS